MKKKEAIIKLKIDIEIPVSDVLQRGVDVVLNEAILKTAPELSKVIKDVINSLIFDRRT